MLMSTGSGGYNTIITEQGHLAVKKIINQFNKSRTFLRKNALCEFGTHEFNITKWTIKG